VKQLRLEMSVVPDRARRIRHLHHPPFWWFGLPPLTRDHPSHSVGRRPSLRAQHSSNCSVSTSHPLGALRPPISFRRSATVS